MRFIILVSFVTLLALGAWAQEDDDMYLEGSSGSEQDPKVAPTDDEDAEFEGSGEVTDPGDDTNIEVGSEPTKETIKENTKDVRVVVIEDDLKVPSQDTPLEPLDEDPLEEKEIDEQTNDEVDIDIEASTGSATTPLLAAVIVGGCIGLLFAICVIMLLVYRMRKKDEGSYALDYGLDKKPQGNYEYTKGVDSKEYFA